MFPYGDVAGGRSKRQWGAPGRVADKERVGVDVLLWGDKEDVDEVNEGRSEGPNCALCHLFRSGLAGTGAKWGIESDCAITEDYLE